MRTVFLFWSIILFILVSGAAAVIYGKMLLKSEIEKEAEIIRELAIREMRKPQPVPALPPDTEVPVIPEEKPLD